MVESASTAAGLISDIKSFAAGHGGAKAVIEYVGRRGARIVLVGEDEAEAEQLLTRRRSRGMPDDGLWAGPVDRFAETVHALEEGGASWVIVVPAGPPDRVELLASTLLSVPH